MTEAETTKKAIFRRTWAGGGCYQYEMHYSTGGTYREYVHQDNRVGISDVRKEMIKFAEDRGFTVYDDNSSPVDMQRSSEEFKPDWSQYN